ncbi:hypothetical protein VNO78_09332 [Psophocarpus tetragonolobus]|uniref:Uncharacterized protein n=1 Tax=Psophocarpus tetragonolobus TaxID=3891 RepID=A0AAN9XT56_PSOTE
MVCFVFEWLLYLGRMMDWCARVFTSRRGQMVYHNHKERVARLDHCSVTPEASSLWNAELMAAQILSYEKLISKGPVGDTMMVDQGKKKEQSVDKVIRCLSGWQKCLLGNSVGVGKGRFLGDGVCLSSDGACLGSESAYLGDKTACLGHKSPLSVIKCLFRQ